MARSHIYEPIQSVDPVSKAVVALPGAVVTLTTSQTLWNAEVGGGSLGTTLIADSVGVVEAWTDLPERIPFTATLAGFTPVTGKLESTRSSAEEALAIHTHDEIDVSGLTADLASKASAADLAGKAALSHSHTEADVAGLLADLAARPPGGGGGGVATNTGTLMDVFSGQLDQAFDAAPAIPTAPTMTLDAQSNKYNTPACVAALIESPPTSLQAQINAAPAGSVLTIIPGYIYREAVTIGKALTIKGANRASLRGSDNWTAGGPSGNTWSGTGPWTSSLTIPAMSLDPVTGTPTDSYSQQHCEQVFVDGVGLQLVNATPVGNQWQIDGSRHVVLGTNPAGHVIEVATRQTVITLSGNNDFVLDGLDIRHCATSGVAAVQAINSSGVTTAKFWILNNMIGWCHGFGINPGGMSNILIQGNILHNCGVSALIASSDTNIQIRRNVFFNNGLPLYGWDPQYGSGGSKVAGSNGVVYDSNIAFANKGVGLWVDVLVTRGVFKNNIVWDTYWPASAPACIQYEVSSFGVIRNNIVFRTVNQPGGLTTQDLGIFISNSRWVDVYGNLVMHCPANVKYQWTPGRTDDPPSNVQDNTHMGGVTIHGNTIIGRYRPADQGGSVSDYAVVWGDDGTGTYSTAVTSNRGGVIVTDTGTLVDGDLYGYPALINNGGTFLEVQQEPDFRWSADGAGGLISAIATWRTAASARIGANSRYMLDADRVGHLRRFGLIP